MPGMPRNAGEVAARELRGSLGIRVEPIGDLRTMLRARPDLVFVERPLTSDFDGAYAYDESLGLGFIYINARPYWTRRRFTMAHELGHHVLGHRQRVDRSIFDLYDSGEVDANAFAAELLMPAAGLAEAPRVYEPEEVAELAAHYWVSGQAMIVRLAALGLIDTARRRRLESVYDARFYASFVENPPPDRADTARTSLPEHFTESVFDLYRRGEITRDAAREALDITERDAEEFLPDIAVDTGFLERINTGAGAKGSDRRSV
jgi:Zn-dependent peptidase ImmA (M78 family)